MNAKEIVNELQSGKRVIINSEDAGEFMMECARHQISGSGIKMSYRNGRCTMTIPQAQSSVRKGLSISTRKDDGPASKSESV